MEKKYSWWKKKIVKGKGESHLWNCNKNNHHPEHFERETINNTQLGLMKNAYTFFIDSVSPSTSLPEKDHFT